MKRFNQLLLSCLFALLLLASCQDEEVIVENPSDEEVIQANSSLAILMQMTVTNDGAVDNLLDNSSCTEIVLPVTITISDTTITINSHNDLWMVAQLLNNPAGNEDIEFSFPITVVFGNYTQIVIENQEQLDLLVDECLTEPEVIECVDFVYPISFAIYNTDFQVIDTVVINSDAELYAFLDGLGATGQGAILASLNFPVTLVYANGDTLEVNGNQELEDAINQAEEDCAEIDCQEEQLEAYLTDCHWNVLSIGLDTETFSEVDVYFAEDGTGTVISANFDVYSTFNWSISETDSGLVLTISDSDGNFIGINGEWSIESCNLSEFVMSQTSATGDVQLVMEQDCTQIENPFDCFADTTITACDYDGDGIALFELETQVLGTVLCDLEFYPTFHTTMAEAETGTNALPAPNSYSNVSNPETIYLRIESNTGDFQVFEIELIVEPCTSTCTELDVDGFLQECVWQVVNLDGSDVLINYELEFNANQELVITGNGMTITGGWSTSQSATGGVEVIFSNVAGPNIQAINGSWIVVACQEDHFELYNPQNNSTMIMEINCQTGCDNPGFLTNDLILYMPFSNEAKDLISGYDATTAANNFVADRDGNATCAIAFDGSNELSIPVTVDNQLVQGDNFSVSIWFKMQNDEFGSAEYMFQKGELTSEGFQLLVYDMNTPLVSDTTNGYGLWDQDWNQQVDVTWGNTDWHHLVVTRDSNNTIRLYRDGILRNIDENSNFNIDQDPLSNYILGKWFDGHLDDLRVYKRTLSSNEVSDLYSIEGDCNQCL
ncbi:MAG TPA: LamG domain-containing protein [Flavobacteriaceae bacterium]|nr:LamG domain-containing protein [Flavobacteriaceae bacterium]